MMAVASVSYLPWPKSWSSSSGLAEMRTKSSTTTSVTKSESEWTASASMAELRAVAPAKNLKSSNSRLTTLPTTVTR